MSTAIIPATTAVIPQDSSKGATRLGPDKITVTDRSVQINAKDDLKCLAGSTLPEFNSALLTEVVYAMGGREAEGAALKNMLLVAGAALSAFKPVDEIEGMIAAQAVALHFGAMECLRRSMITGQPGEVASKLRKDAANLARAMTEMIDALDRKRGKGPQGVRVERVVVHEGGQAIVGNVNPGLPG